MRKLIDSIANVYVIIALVGLIILIATMIFEIVMRYFTSSSIIWLHEFLGIVIIWITFLGFGKIVADREDIMITFLVEKFEEKTRKVIMYINTILLLIISIVLSITSISLAIKGFNRSTLLLEAPYTLYYFPLVLLMLLVTLIMIEHLRQIKDGNIDIFTARQEGEK
ncbi:TRAP transporter small permease [Jeotgalicoccus nanhaiensis]|uniref:TRAP transporter small permease n=1 Tax=Jeotgalicoccus nanhaiensis TaxID=568603 RepID=A0ABR9XZH2_9STAP|nr:TRAP transporter small permease [Jeotgalicoccus nanhaiensis]MBF0754155.1 TRAP transporter small permease [Jeotgalicoccus nanhaiensis]TFU61342.1 TRAP transporter small permease [Jeotgalicoccus nanhaiensis]